MHATKLDVRRGEPAMKKAIRESLVFVFLIWAVSFAYLVSMSAQVQTQTTTTTHQGTIEAKVDRAEVVHVSGNDLIVKMEDGTIRHIPNVPDSARVTVDGNQLGIHDLKVGMKLQRTITTTTTPKTITTVQSVTGKVWHVNPPSSVILTLQDGTNQQFKIPKDQKFNVDGQMVDAWGLKKGMRVTATKVVEEPVTEIEQQRKLTGSMPPPPAAPPADEPILVASAEPVPAPAGTPAPEKLPKTGTELPLVGLFGLFLVLSGLSLRAFRRWLT
jgi:LPXTG-motif cell wall-anchored protein